MFRLRSTDVSVLSVGRLTPLIRSSTLCHPLTGSVVTCSVSVIRSFSGGVTTAKPGSRWANETVVKSPESTDKSTDREATIKELDRLRQISNSTIKSTDLYTIMQPYIRTPQPSDGWQELATIWTMLYEQPNRLLDPSSVTMDQLNHLIRVCGRRKNAKVLLQLYELLIKPKLPNTVRHLPPIDLDAAYATQKQHRPVTKRNSISSMPPVDTTTSTDSNIINPMVLHLIQQTISVLVEIGSLPNNKSLRPHALTLYRHLWYTIESMKDWTLNDPTTQLRFSSLPILTLIKLLRNERHHEEVVYLYTIIQLEWLDASQHWLKLHQASKKASAPSAIPPFPPSFSNRDGVIELVLDSLIVCTAQNKRRIIEYFVGECTKQSEQLEKMIFASNGDQSIAPSPIELNLFESIRLRPRTDGEDATSQESVLQTQYTQIEVPDVRDGLETTSDDSDVKQSRSRLNLFRRGLRLILADWIRCEDYEKSSHGNRPHPFLPPSFQADASNAQKKLYATTDPILFHVGLTGWLSKEILQQLTSSLLRYFPSGPRLAHSWWTILYNRSIDVRSGAQRLEEPTGDKAERLALTLPADVYYLRDRSLAHTLPLRQYTWTLGFRLYLRSSAGYSHSWAQMANKTESQSARLVHSPFVMLKHLLNTKSAHAINTHATDVSDDSATQTNNDLPPPGTELTWQDWYTFWNHLDLIRAETSNVAASYDSLSSDRDLQPSTKKVAKELYERLSQGFLDASWEYGRKHGLMQVIENSASLLGDSSHLFVIHLPSSLFPKPRSSGGILDRHLRLALRCMQKWMESEDGRGKSVALVLVFGCRSVTHLPARENMLPSDVQTERVHPSTPILPSPWFTQMAAVVENSMKEQFRMNIRPDSHITKIPEELHLIIRGHPIRHEMMEHQLMVIDSVRMDKWRDQGFLSFLLDSLDLPPNSCPVESNTYKMPNPSSIAPIASYPAVNVPQPKVQPGYSSQTYYLNDLSPFIRSRRHHSPFFDSSGDLHQQEQEWRELLDCMKKDGRGEDTSA